MNHIQKIHHILNRAAFGPSLKDLMSYQNASISEITKHLFHASEDFKEIKVVHQEILSPQKLRSLSEKQKRELRKKSRENILKLNTAWFKKMVITEAVLREKMTLFWHDHFACRTNNAWFAQDLNNRLRRNALGNFGTMLMEVSKSSAMLQFLNNQQNKKEHPNENFAREVMELFTLGRDNYTEDDIKNAARAFTGWGFNYRGEFIFRKQTHDFGRKIFLGNTGNFGGEDILQIILNNKQTANFITRKIWQYFVNEKINEEHMTDLATGFYNSGYDLKALMTQIFTSEWFYSPENYQSIIKSPVELLAGYTRLLPVSFTDQRSLLLLQRAMGQVLFYPPNVGGWPSGKEWIDSTSLTFRMQLPLLMVMSSSGNNSRKMGRSGIKLQADWPEFYENIREINKNELAILVLGKEPDPKEQKLIAHSMEKTTDPMTKSVRQVLAWLSLPEYQLA